MAGRVLLVCMLWCSLASLLDLRAHRQSCRVAWYLQGRAGAHRGRPACAGKSGPCSVEKDSGSTGSLRCHDSSLLVQLDYLSPPILAADLPFGRAPLFTVEHGRWFL